MAEFELLIACCNFNNISPGSMRAKEGDIVTFAPSPREWGVMEKKHFFAVPVSNITEQELKTLCEPQYADGLTVSEYIAANPEYTEEELMSREISSKRRYQLNLNILKIGWNPSLDIDLVRNWNTTYQPFKNSMITIDFSEKVSICKDKVKGSYKYITQKIYGE